MAAEGRDNCGGKAFDADAADSERRNGRIRQRQGLLERLLVKAHGRVAELRLRRVLQFPKSLQLPYPCRFARSKSVASVSNAFEVAVCRF
jgi:hypothetical protein